MIALLGSSLAATGVSVRQAANRNAYTLMMASGKRTLPVRSSGGRETVSLDQLATLFALSISEDPSLGLTIRARNQQILLIPGQAFAQVAGRVVRLSGPIERDRSGWQVPLDFIASAIGPALNLKVDLRRDSRLIVVGDVRVPRVSGRFEKRGTAGRLLLEVEPPTPHRVVRDGQALLVRFDADMLDPGGFTDLAKEFVTAVRVDGTTLRIELGPAPASFDVSDAGNPGRVSIDLLPPAPPPPPAPKPAQTPPPGAAPQPPPALQPPAVIDPTRAGAIRTIVIDPGHGGDDEGARGKNGVKEKDVALRVAVRIKAAIETRWGLRVLLTREGDVNVSLDRRTAIANNNKADLFISLHANASVRPAVRGAQVLTLSVDDYRERAQALNSRTPPVPILGGGLRAIEPVPWDIAQVPVADKSAQLGGLLVRHLTERNVPLDPAAAAQAPLRVLVGAYMPALMLEMGFLTNADDELALGGAQLSGDIVEAVLASIADVRFGFPPPAGTHRP
jgi:N-acetylmuramoyl-L-alanine amidase